MRASAIRIVAVLILALALVGGGYLSTTTRDREQAVATNQHLLAATSQLHLDYQRTGEQVRAGRAAQRQVEADVKGRADAAGKVMADTVKLADAQAAKAADKKPKPYDGPIPASCNEYSGNQAAGCALLLASGFGLDQVPCLVNLWNKESGWNVTAKNRSSGAYGIPQALPGSKMGPGWETSAEVQITWGIGYIKSRYGSPCGAWGVSQAKGWY